MSDEGVSVSRSGQLDSPVAEDPFTKQFFQIAERVAESESTVMISGESGTGKELIAKAIHIGSDRKDNPFIANKCAAITENLLVSELFVVIAHYPGLHNKEVLKGKVRLDDGGTIILDEI